MTQARVQIVRTVSDAGVVDEEEAWDFVRSLLGRAAPLGHPRLELRETADAGLAWHPTAGVTAAAAKVLDLCLPLCTGSCSKDVVVAHLGQSLDGRVAVPPGASRLITGPEDVRHTHRLRALCDAVVVGATTVLVDDPELTTRLVRGEHPVRVVLDPQARLPRDRRLFTDGKAASLVIVGCEHAAAYGSVRGVEALPLPLHGGRLRVHDVIGALRARGLPRIFVEGGGVTVSRFLDAGALDRLHIAVASRIVGTGAPALELDGARLGAGIAATVRSHLLGADVLFDCDLRAVSSGCGPS